MSPDLSLQDLFLKALEFAGIDSSSRVVVGVSGGVDSMVLLHVLHSFRPDSPHCIVAHLDHGIRGDEARQDRRLVERTSVEWNFPFVSRQINLGADASEEQARSARMEFFRLIAAGFKTDSLLVAHHRDDLAENLVFRLARGGMPESIPGMQAVSFIDGLRIVRPMLAISRADIETYAAQHSVPFRTDSTNSSPKYTRNAIRNNILPELEKIVPGALVSIGETAMLLASDNDEISGIAAHASLDLVSDCSWGVSSLPIEEIRHYPGFILRRILNILAGSTIGRDAWKQISTLAPEIGIDLPGGARLRTTDTTLIVARPWPEMPVDGIPLEIPGSAHLPDGSIISAELVDDTDIFFNDDDPFTEFIAPGADKLLIRQRRDGDRFFPLGAPGERKLQDFLTDAPVIREMRDRIPLVEIDGEIVWVVGERISEHFKLPQNAPSAIKLSLIPGWL